MRVGIKIKAFGAELRQIGMHITYLCTPHRVVLCVAAPLWDPGTFRVLQLHARPHRAHVRTCTTKATKLATENEDRGRVSPTAGVTAESTVCGKRVKVGPWGRTVRCTRAVRKVGYFGSLVPDCQGGPSNYYDTRLLRFLFSPKNSDSKLNGEQHALCAQCIFLI